MGASKTSISPQHLIDLVGTPACPVIFDVRRREVFEQAGDLIPTATWQNHRQPDGPAMRQAGARPLVVYCVYGHQVGQATVALLRADGIDARYLEGGIEAYRAASGPLVKNGVLPKRPDGGPSRWVTRERPKIDRIACPWFIRRFVDREAAIHFVETEWVRDAAVELDAIPFDIPNVEFSHFGELCSFDAFLDRFGVNDPALRHMAAIIRGADTGHPELAPQAPGLLAMSLGLSALYPDDLAMMDTGFTLYDSLYAWCRYAATETHGWPPAPTSKRTREAVQ